MSKVKWIQRYPKRPRPKWLVLTMQTFENVKLPDGVIGYMPIYHTMADAEKAGFKREQLVRCWPESEADHDA